MCSSVNWQLSCWSLYKLAQTFTSQKKAGKPQAEAQPARSKFWQVHVVSFSYSPPFPIQDICVVQNASIYLVSMAQDHLFTSAQWKFNFCDPFNHCKFFWGDRLQKCLMIDIIWCVMNRLSLTFTVHNFRQSLRLVSLWGNWKSTFNKPKKVWQYLWGCLIERVHRSCRP